MATTTNITTTYAGEAAAGYIGTTLRNSPTIHGGGVEVIANIPYKRVIKRYEDNGILSDATCDFTPTTTVILDERILTPKELQVNLEFCKKDFVDDWESARMGFSAWKTVPPEFATFVMARIAEQIAASNEQNIWSGNAASSGEFGGFLSLFAADANVIDVDSGAITIDATNVIDEMQKVIAAGISANASLFSSVGQDLHLYVPTNVWASYLFALGGFASGGLGANGFETRGPNQDFIRMAELYFAPVKVFHAPGMTANQMVLARRSNLYFGTGLLADHTRVAILDMEPVDLSQNFRVAARFTAGVQYGFGSEIVYYWNAP